MDCRKKATMMDKKTMNLDELSSFKIIVAKDLNEVKIPYTNNFSEKANMAQEMEQILKGKKYHIWLGTVCADSPSYDLDFQKEHCSRFFRCFCNEETVYYFTSQYNPIGGFIYKNEFDKNRTASYDIYFNTIDCISAFFYPHEFKLPDPKDLCCECLTVINQKIKELLSITGLKSLDNSALDLYENLIVELEKQNKDLNRINEENQIYKSQVVELENEILNLKFNIEYMITPYIQNVNRKIET